MIQELDVFNEWVESQVNILRSTHPDKDEKLIRLAVERIAKKKINDREVTLHNSHLNQRQKMPLSKLMSFVEKQKPIISGYGVLYLNQDLVYNPSSNMLKGFQMKRDIIKDRLKVISQGTYEYILADLQQEIEKVCVNSYYGSCGAPTSRFFNIYNAASATITGQIIISTASQAFEGFLTNNVPFYDLDDCIEFILSIEEEGDLRYSKIEVPDVPIEKVVNKLMDGFTETKDSYEHIIRSYLTNLDQSILNKVYYKNNFYEFTNTPEVLSKWRTMMSSTSAYILPQNIPSEIKDDLHELWLGYRDYVYLNRSPKGRIQRLRSNERKSVIVVDTDSNVIHIQNHVDYIFDDVCKDIPEVQNSNYDDTEMTIANIICYMMSELVSLILNDLTTRSNILPEYAKLVQMKNEFLASTIMTTRNKKWYSLISKLREGVLLDPPKVTIKGMSFIKSTTNDVTKEFFESLVKNRVLLPSRDISVMGVMSDVRKFEDMIKTSLDEGQTLFATPHKTKDIEAYAYPDRIQSVRASIAWNAVYPDQPINPPDRILVLKVNLDTLEDLEDLKEDHSDIYYSLKRGVFEHPNPDIAGKGINVFAIPSSQQIIPEWIRPYLNKYQIVDDNIKLSESLMHALGLSTQNMARMEVTNIMRVGSEGLQF